MQLEAQNVRDALARHKAQLMKMDNVIGVGMGIKERQGKPTGEVVVTVLVSKKVHRTELRTEACIPTTLRQKCTTDVIEVGIPRLLADFDRLERSRPAQPGISIGHYLVTAGTLGAIVLDNKTGQRLILSNNHVLANISDGTDGRASKGDAIVQPGTYDGGTVPDDVIATLERFIPLYCEVGDTTCQFAKTVERVGNAVLRPIRPEYRMRLQKAIGKQNLVDAALALPTSPDLVDPEILGLGKPQGVASSEPGLAIIKSGRTSGITEGTIRAVDVTIQVQLGDLGAGLMTDQVITTPIAQPGDSGSLVLTKGDNHVVGLLSAGSDQATIFGRWENVSSLLDVSLDMA